MKQIQGLTDQGNQLTTIILPDGSRVTLRLEFRPQQIGWFYDLSWPGTNDVPFILNGQRLVTSPNILRQYRQIIPFGLALVTPQNIEPTTQSAFIDGTASLLLLDSSDIATIEAQIFPGL